MPTEVLGWGLSKYLKTPYDPKICRESWPGIVPILFERACSEIPPVTSDRTNAITPVIAPCEFLETVNGKRSFSGCSEMPQMDELATKRTIAPTRYKVCVNQVLAFHLRPRSFRRICPIHVLNNQILRRGQSASRTSWSCFLLHKPRLTLSDHMQLSVIIPTYREAKNLAVLLPRLAGTIATLPISAEIIIVDDDSQDGTRQLCASLQLGIGDKEIPVRLITRINERGLSSAVVRGMDEAEGDILLCMDADLSHPVEAVPDLYKSLTRTDRPAEFVIGSRYVPGGSTAADWGFARWLNSKVATWLALPLTRVNDPMAGFFALRRSDFHAAKRSGLSPIGYKIGLELLVKSGVKVVEEVPIHFEDRLHGESKLNLKEQLNYVRHLARLYRHSFPGLMKFASFSAVGSTGVAVDLSVLAVGLSLGLSPSLAAVLAIWIAMSWNFALNRRFTFADDPSAGDVQPDNRSNASRWAVVRQYGKFCVSCLTGAVVNWSVRVSLLATTLAFADRPYLASIAGILCGLVFNYSICSRFVFGRRRPEQDKPTNKPNDVWSALPSNSTAAESDLPQVMALAKSEWAVAATAPTNRSVVVDSPDSIEDSEQQIAQRQFPTRSTNVFRVALFLAVVTGASWTSAFLDLPTTPTTPATRTTPNSTGKVDPRVGKVDPKAQPVTTAIPPTSTPQANAADLPFALDTSKAAIAKRLLDDCTYLASDDLEGRGVRTGGLDLAAEYIAKHYEKAHLRIDHFDKSPFQQFRLYSQGTDGAVQALSFLAGTNETTLEPQEDYTSIFAAKTARFEAGVVFVGFGITAPEIDYDSYANIDVKGKCVVVLRHAPSIFSGPKATELQDHTFIRTKINNARKHKAAAIVFCSDLSEVNRIKKIAQDERIHEPLLKVELTSDGEQDDEDGGGGGIPTVHCRRSTVAEFLAKADFDLDKVEQQITDSNKPASQELPSLTVRGSVAKIRLGQKLKNVIGLLPGEGPLADETIVLGAHYDHLGLGGWGSLSSGANDAIHNGADDNASGTAMLLEAARQLATRKTPFKRSVLFIAFSGEELGLIGSKQYVRDPLVPISDTIAMLNLDMVGRLRNQQLTVYGTGTAQVWPNLLEAAAAPHKIEITSRSGGYGPSDHASFYEKGVPVLHFFTGFHPQYHRPSDDIDLLNVEGMQQITAMVVGMIEQIAEAKDRPKRTVAADNVAGDPSISLDQLMGNGKAPRTALLGVVPVEKDGAVHIEKVVKGSGADQAGLKFGDQIIKVDEIQLKSQDQLIELVRAKKSGDKVTIQIRRNGILLELDVML